MSVDYSREKCEDFIQRALDLGTTTFVRLWMYMAGFVPAGSYQLDALFVESMNMSLWNKQGVLFLMVPHIERIAASRAQEVCGLARQQEPL